MQISTESKLITARGITKFGDHAWDLAIPIMLARIFPGSLTEVAAYLLINTAATVLLIPKLSRWFNNQNRLINLNFYILSQTVGVSVTLLLLYLPDKDSSILFLPLIIFAGVITKVGASLSDLSLYIDWIPSIFRAQELPNINSRIRRIDLLMEVLAPAITGFVLLLDWGFELVALANILTFIVEYRLLRIVYRKFDKILNKQDLHKTTENSQKVGIHGFKALAAQYAFPVILANACLWFTVLTPHGALLTAYLKDTSHITENYLGIFRASGALIGILPTFYYGYFRQRIGALKFATFSITFQLIWLILALLTLPNDATPWIALAAIIISRVGLYGFVLAELEIRQTTVPESIRLEVSGAASAIKHSANLALYISAVIWSDPKQFMILATATVIVIGIGTMLTWGRLIYKPKAI